MKFMESYTPRHAAPDEELFKPERAFEVNLCDPDAVLTREEREARDRDLAALAMNRRAGWEKHHNDVVN